MIYRRLPIRDINELLVMFIRFDKLYKATYKSEIIEVNIMSNGVNQFDLSNMSNDEIKNKDFKDCILERYLLNKEKEDGKYPNIKKWLQYDLFAKEDADEVLKNSDILIRKLEWYDETTISKKRYYDCIFSMTTHFNMFLRLYEPRAAFSHSWLLYHFDEVFSGLSILENCLDALDKLAKNTHTIGNYMPCPDETYNKGKGYSRGFEVFNDRIELLLQELKERKYTDYIIPECAENWEKWFDENVKKLCLEGLFKGNFENIKNSKLNDSLLDFPTHKKIGRVYRFEYEDIEAFENYLKFVNEWIETRRENLFIDRQIM